MEVVGTAVEYFWGLSFSFSPFADKIVRDRATGRSRQCGFVGFATDEAADRVCVFYVCCIVCRLSLAQNAANAI